MRMSRNGCPNGLLDKNKEGDVILAPPPQAAGRADNRPALLLREMPGHGDVALRPLRTGVQRRHRPLYRLTHIAAPFDCAMRQLARITCWLSNERLMV